jgi:hypothetical protein
MINAKDLTQEPARSPRTRIGGYVLLARMADKGRATINGTAGEYHFDCPVDNLLFGFKGVNGEEVKPLLASGASDEEIAAWLDTHGTPKTAAEVTAWGDSIVASSPFHDPAKKEWFIGECVALGLNPETATFCDYLEADDRASFPHHAPRKSALLIGLDPELIDFSLPEFAAFPGMTAAKVMAGLNAAQEGMKAFGFDVQDCFTDFGQTAEAVVTAKLQESQFDCIMIGAGIRTIPSNFFLFEKLINVVHEHAPHSKICFNTKPTDTMEALQRWT